MVIFLKPNWSKFLLFTTFVLIASGFQSQSSAFASDSSQLIAPSSNLIESSPSILWILWICLLLPLMFLLIPFKIIGLEIDELWWLIQLIYYYTLSCLLCNMRL